MAIEIPSTEYDYFKPERSALESIEPGNHVLLYLCIQDDPATMPIPESMSFYGKLACNLIRFAIPEPREPDGKDIIGLPPVVDLRMHPVYGNDIRALDFRVHDDNFLASESPRTMTFLYKTFTGLHADKCLGDSALKGRGILVTESFLIDLEPNKAPLKSMMAEHGGRDDGSAGVREPARPLQPKPQGVATFGNSY